MTTPDPNTPPPATGPSDETKAGFKALFNEAMEEWYTAKQEELKAEPPVRTQKPRTFLDDVLNFGRPA